MDSPAPPPTAGGPASRWPAAVAVVSLGLNLLVAGWLWRAQTTQEQRLARLENPGLPAPTERAVRRSSDGPEATRQDRVAFLLASAGRLEDSRRILANLSPPECVEMAHALIAKPPAGDRNAALGAVFEHIATSEPTLAVKTLGDVQEPILRNTLAIQISDLWIAQDAEAAVRWVAAQGRSFLTEEGAYDGQLSKGAARWSAYNAEAATRFLSAQSPTDDTLLQALYATSLEWGRKTPQAALQWAQSLPVVDPRRADILLGTLTGWTSLEPVPAASYLQSQLYGGGDGGELYVSLAAAVANTWAETDPNAAAQWAAALPSIRARRDALSRVAAVWIKTDLAAAARWAATLPASEARSEAWRLIVTSWPPGELDSAGLWVGNLLRGLDRDEATAILAERLSGTDPQKALTWAQTIGDGRFQARNVQAILARWERRDLAAASNWAAANSVELPPPARQPVPR